MIAQETAGPIPQQVAGDAVDPAPRWNLLQKVAFRFFFSYFVLYFVMTWPVSLLPFADFLVEMYTAVWFEVVTWAGKSVLRVPYDIYLIDGSGGISNTAHGSILFLCWVATAALAALVWSVVDRRRPHYRRLHQWFRLMLRCTLALAMIRYGALKVIPTQMLIGPPLTLLGQRLGDLTRMRLLWLFMGASPEYQSLTGLAELTGGLLLLFPRTTLLGALLSTLNMSMVFTLNMCFDVHVKLYSFHLLFMAVLLVAPDLPRLANVLLFNRRVEPAEAPPLFSNKWLNRAPHVLLFLLGAYTTVTVFQEAWGRYQKFYPPKPPLYGAWKVEELTFEGQEVPFTEASRWRSVSFQVPKRLSVEPLFGRRVIYALDLDLEGKTMALERLEVDDQGLVVEDAQGEAKRAAAGRATLYFTQPEEDVMVLDGQFDGRPIHAKLHKMPLIRRGFHWLFDPGPDAE